MALGWKQAGTTLERGKYCHNWAITALNKSVDNFFYSLIWPTNLLNIEGRLKMRVKSFREHALIS